jgi:hypothetical protein
MRHGAPGFTTEGLGTPQMPQAWKGEAFPASFE